MLRKLTTSVSMPLVRNHVEKLESVSIDRDKERQSAYARSTPTIE
jgi:hypothetical protein